MSDCHAETGSVDWDLENFFNYYSLVKTVSNSVSANRFAWWICADSAEDAATLAIDKLDDRESMWSIFSSQAVAKRELDRSRFDALFASRSEDA